MQVFIPFDDSDEAIPFLEEALNAWENVRWAKPEVIQVKPGPKAEIMFRVAADGLAKAEYYLTADIDAVVEETYLISTIRKQLRHLDTLPGPKAGLALIRPIFDQGGRVRVVRKGAVTSWPPQVSLQYDVEHAAAVIQAGFTFQTWDDIFYRKMPSLVVN